MKCKNTRAPIVSVMGHVNHGKTSLIDSICFKNTLSSESGRITQHIKVYNIVTHDKKSITFIDTPGHEIFTPIRIRGGILSDIVIIIIAVDEGIKRQTIESINYAKKLCIPIIIAINKVDKTISNLQKVKNSLLKYELVPEDMGGDCIVLPISTKTRYGLTNVITAIFFYAESLNLNIDFDVLAEAIVIDAKIDLKVGIIATVLVSKGVLKAGRNAVLRGNYFKIKTLIDNEGREVSQVLPSLSVQLVGINFLPQLGEKLSVVNNNLNIDKKKLNRSNRAYFKGEINRLLDINVNIIIKVDTSSSIEIIKSYIKKIKKAKIILHLLDLGNISKSDISLAKITKSLVFLFNVKIDKKITEFAKNNNINVKYYDTIHKLIDEIGHISLELSKPKKKELLLGKANIIAKINISKLYIAGCIVTQGKMKNNYLAKIIRKKKELCRCRIHSLKHFNKSVDEVSKGLECGILFQNFSSFEQGDVIELYEFIDNK